MPKGKLSFQKKALHVIEMICELESESFQPVTEDRFHDILGKLYKLAHVAGGHCENPHTEWEEELEKIYIEFKKNNIL